MQVKPKTTWDNAPEEKKPVEAKKEEPKKEEAMKGHKDVCAQGNLSVFPQQLKALGSQPR